MAVTASSPSRHWPTTSMSASARQQGRQPLARERLVVHDQRLDLFHGGGPMHVSRGGLLRDGRCRDAIDVHGDPREMLNWPNAELEPRTPNRLLMLPCGREPTGGGHSRHLQMRSAGAAGLFGQRPDLGLPGNGHDDRQPAWAGGGTRTGSRRRRGAAAARAWSRPRCPSAAPSARLPTAPPRRRGLPCAACRPRAGPRCRCVRARSSWPRRA